MDRYLIDMLESVVNKNAILYLLPTENDCRALKEYAYKYGDSNTNVDALPVTKETLYTGYEQGHQVVGEKYELNNELLSIIKGLKTTPRLVIPKGIIDENIDKVKKYLDKNDIPVLEIPFGNTYESIEATFLKALKFEDNSLYMPRTAEQYISSYKAENGLINKIRDLYTELAEMEDTNAEPTGYKLLDSYLHKGIRPGLYTIGAVSSLGKSSFVIQLMDNIARSGRDVLYFSLEMAERDIISRSISRLTTSMVNPKEIIENASTSLEVLEGAEWDNYSTTKKNAIRDAFNEYSKYANHIFIFSSIDKNGFNRFTSEDISRKIEKHIALTGNAPVVIVDYLQILKPTDARATEKQNTDTDIFNLKNAAIKNDAPVILISSFNREAYYTDIGLEAFKESGAIEYTSDVVIALQFKFSDASISKEDKKYLGELTSQLNTRDLTLKILKNRYGSRGNIDYIFYSKFNAFYEGGKHQRMHEQDIEEYKNILLSKIKE